MLLGQLKKKLSSILLILFFLIPCLQAQTKDFATVYDDFSGGFNDWTPASSLPLAQSPTTQNLIIDETPSKATKRRGYVDCGNIPSGNVPIAIFNFTPSVGDERLIIFDKTNSYETTDCVNFVTIHSTLTAGTVPDCEMVYAEIWCLNGTDEVFRWDGTIRIDMDGTWTNPDVPKGAHIEFEKGRVWISRTASSQSSLFFSGLTNLTGDIVVPSSSTAWIAANEIFIGKDDGDTINGIKRYLGTVFIFKGMAIWKVTGEDEFSFGGERVLVGYGVNANKTIVEIDNFIHATGKNGIYQFDGVRAVRLLDKRSPTFVDIQQPLSPSSGQAWTTKEEWEAGVSTNVSTSQIVGSVELSTGVTLTDDFTDGDLTNNPTWVQNAGSWGVSASSRANFSGTIGHLRVTSSELNGFYRFTLEPLVANVTRTGFGFIGNTNNTSCAACVAPGYYAIFRNTGGTSSLSKCSGGSITSLCTFNTAAADSIEYRVEKNGNDFKVFADDIEQCSVSDSDITATVLSFACVDAVGLVNFDVFDDLEISTYVVSGDWESETIDGTADLTAWGTLNGTSENNGETLTFSKRLGDTIDEMRIAPYTSLLIGETISTTTIRYMQLRASLSRSVSNAASSPELQSLSASWVAGTGAELIPWAGSWNSRYWLTYARQGQSSKDRVLVKSKEPLKISFMPYVGMSISAFEEINDSLYGVSSSTDDIFILDSGFRDGSSAINAFWTTGDNIFGLPFNHKYLHFVFIDYEKTGAGNLNIGWSSDQGSTFTEKALFQSGSGRSTGRIDAGANPSTMFRFRIRQSGIDEEMELHNIMPVGVSEPSVIQ